MFSQLEDVFGSLEFEDSGLARITSVVEESEGLRVRLHLRFDAADVAPQAWEFTCGDVQAYDFRHEPITTIGFVSTHPLLVPYTARSVSLSFVGVPPSPSAVVGELWEAHQAATDGWFSFDAFLNTGLKTADLLASGSGILGEGPRPVLEAYARVLERHGLRVAWVGEREPRDWRDGAWVPSRRDLQALILDASYIIGGDWTDARRVG